MGEKQQELMRRLGRWANPVFFEVEMAGFSIVETNELRRLQKVAECAVECGLECAERIQPGDLSPPLSPFKEPRVQS